MTLNSLARWKSGALRARRRASSDAAPVQADAPGPVGLDHGDSLAQLGRPDRRDVAARARADDDGVEALVRHGGSDQE